VLFVILALSQELFAQPVYFGDSPISTFGFEIRKPDFENNLVSGAGVFLNFEPRVWEKAKLLIEIPLTFYNRDATAFLEEESETALGNLFFGIRTLPVSAPTYFECGMRLPTSEEDDGNALSAGMLADYPRLDAFMPDYFALKAALGHKTWAGEDLSARFKIGPMLFLETSDNPTVEDEFAVNYGGHLLYISEVVNFGGGLSGITLLTEEDDNTEIQFDLSLSLNAERFRPGIEFYFPLTDNLDDAVEYIIGFGLEIEIR
jgi:hypothetical protein